MGQNSYIMKTGKTRVGAIYLIKLDEKSIGEKIDTLSYVNYMNENQVQYYIDMHSQ